MKSNLEDVHVLAEIITKTLIHSQFSTLKLNAYLPNEKKS